MKRLLQRSMAVALTAAMVITLAPSQADAAKKPKLSNSKIVATVGKTITIKVKNANKKAKVTWKSSKPKVAKIARSYKNGNKVVVNCVKSGKTKITASYKLGKKITKLVCTVAVKKKVDPVTAPTSAQVLNPSAKPTTAVGTPTNKPLVTDKPVVKPTSKPNTPTKAPTKVPTKKPSATPKGSPSPSPTPKYTKPPQTAKPVLKVDLHSDSIVFNESKDGATIVKNNDGSITLSFTKQYAAFNFYLPDNPEIYFSQYKSVVLKYTSEGDGLGHALYDIDTVPDGSQAGAEPGKHPDWGNKIVQSTTDNILTFAVTSECNGGCIRGFQIFNPNEMDEGKVNTITIKGMVFCTDSNPDVTKIFNEEPKPTSTPAIQPTKAPTVAPATAAPATKAPTVAPATAAPATAAPATAAPATAAPATAVPATAAPATQAPSGAASGSALKTDTAIVADGDIEAAWNATDYVDMNTYSGTKGATTAKGKVMWDDKNLYALVVVTDADIDSTATDDYQRDGGEIFLDEDNSREKDYKTNTDAFQYRFTGFTQDASTSALTAAFQGGKGTDYSGIVSAYKVTKDTEGKVTGYVIEYKVPFKNAVKADQIVGFDLSAFDCTAGKRDNEIQMFGPARADLWQDASIFSTLQLVEPVAPVKYGWDATNTNYTLELNTSTVKQSANGGATAKANADGTVTVTNTAIYAGGEITLPTDVTDKFSKITISYINGDGGYGHCANYGGTDQSIVWGGAMSGSGDLVVNLDNTQTLKRYSFFNNSPSMNPDDAAYVVGTQFAVTITKVVFSK